MNTLQRVWKLLAAPSAAWRAIDQENVPLWRLYLCRVMPWVLLAICSVMLGQFLHEGTSFLRAPETCRRMLVLLGWAVLVLYVQLTLVALVIHLVAPWFGGQRNLRKAFALIFHAAMGLLVAAVVQPLAMPFFPLPMVLGGAWLVYLLLEGMPVLMRMPPRKARVPSALALVLYVLFNSLLMPLADQAWARAVSAVSAPDGVVRAGDAPTAPAPDRVFPLNEMQQADRNLDEAAREAGNARARNDSLAAAQAARDAVTAMAATVAGGQERVPLASSELTRWFPRELLGQRLQSLVVEPWGGVSSRAVMAHGNYGRSGGPTLELRVIDPASAGALLAESAASNAPERKENETAATRERNWQEGGRRVSELVWKDSDRVEVGYVLANGVRLTANASGGGVEAQALHAALRALPLDVLEKNRMVPVSGTIATTPP